VAKKPEYYVVVESFVDTEHGISVPEGEIVAAGHEIMKNRDWAFKPWDGPERFGKVEQATAAPGEEREQEEPEEAEEEPKPKAKPRARGSR
jgi:hypothetical protein